MVQWRLKPLKKRIISDRLGLSDICGYERWHALAEAVRLFLVNISPSPIYCLLNGFLFVPLFDRLFYTYHPLPPDLCAHSNCRFNHTFVYVARGGL